MNEQFCLTDKKCEYAAPTCDPKDRIFTMCNHPGGQKDVMDIQECPAGLKKEEPKETPTRKTRKGSI